MFLGALAVVGYLMPEGSASTPPRVLLDNGGGRVIFSHASHTADYGFKCADCHHDQAGDPAHPVPCGTCHPKEFGPEFAATHRHAFPSPDYCQRCHDTEPDMNAAPNSMSAEDKPDSGNIPTRMDAFHDQCMGCHRDNGAGPFEETECSACHAQ